MTSRVAQVVEQLPSKYEALSSRSSTTKGRKEIHTIRVKFPVSFTCPKDWNNLFFLLAHSGI
jgi:hypothetical protein